jgi:hypothetical protein
MWSETTLQTVLLNSELDASTGWVRGVGAAKDDLRRKASQYAGRTTEPKAPADHASELMMAAGVTDLTRAQDVEDIANQR